MNRVIYGFIAFTILVAGAVVWLVPVVYDTADLADTLFLANLGWRVFNGAQPVLDFGHFYAGLTGQYIALSFALFGPVLKALDYAIVLMLATCLTAGALVSWRRISLMGFALFALVVTATILTRAPFEMGGSLTRVTSAHSFLYNRFALGLLAVLVIFALRPAHRPQSIELLIAALAGVVMVMIPLLKPTFVVVVPALLFALLVQRRLLGAVALVAGAGLAIFMLDPGLAKFLGAFDYATATAGGDVQVFGLIKKAIRLLLSQPIALALTLAGLALFWAGAGPRRLGQALAALAMGASGLGLAVTMGGEGALGQQMLPVMCLMLICWAFPTEATAVAPPHVVSGTRLVASVLIAAFALPHLANTAAAGLEAMRSKSSVIFTQGPLAGYLSLSDAFVLPPRTEPGAAWRAQITQDAAAHLHAGNRPENGVQYVLLMDGLDLLNTIEGVDQYGIVADGGLDFTFALGSPPVLGYPVWQRSNSPEFAPGRPLPADVDIALLQRLADPDRLGRKRVQDGLVLCRQSALWDLFVRAGHLGQICQN